MGSHLLFFRRRCPSGNMILYNSPSLLSTCCSLCHDPRFVIPLYLLIEDCQELVIFLSSTRKEAICLHLLPKLRLQMTAMLALPIRFGGLWILDPQKTATTFRFQSAIYKPLTVQFFVNVISSKRHYQKLIAFPPCSLSPTLQLSLKLAGGKGAFHPALRMSWLHPSQRVTFVMQLVLWYGWSPQNLLAQILRLLGWSVPIFFYWH